MDEISKHFESRKFTLAVLLVLLATVALGLTWISQATWLSVVQLVGGGYFVANVSQKAIPALQAALAGKKEA